MTSRHIQIAYQQGAQWRDLPAPALRCATGAVDALSKSYAPYSNFNVGAAIISEDHEIIIGSNQENAAYPQCLCAEQVCVHHFEHATTDVHPVLMAIAVRGDLPAMPCGSCRQVLHEWAGRHGRAIPLFAISEEGPYIHLTDLQRLLPFAFTPDHLLHTTL